jgi:ribonuclease I
VKIESSVVTGFAPTASIAIPGEKLGMDPWIDQSACCGLCQETFFSGAVVLLNSVDDYTKGCYVLTV